jgi:putative spermidine/putrescine transport system ATP-binding protein/putrescine transport system ATP-binding protein
MTIVLEVCNIVKCYDSIAAVDGLSFCARRGECVSLLGPSGCGKTSTLRVIAGFEEADQGDVLIGGQDMRGKRPYERTIGIVFQDYALFPHMTVKQNIVYGMRHRGVERQEMDQRLKKMLAIMHLSGYEDRRPAQLSGGEQQRVALSRALATQPSLLLLDEPMSNLDARLRDQVRVELKEILKSVDITTVLVTHDQQEAMSIADRIIVMSGGKKMQEGTPTEIYMRPNNKFTAEFVGRTNWFQGRLRNEAAPGLWACDAETGEKLVVSCQEGCVGEFCEIGVRPERLHVALRDAFLDKPEFQTNRITGNVLRSEFLGADVHLWIGLNNGTRIIAVLKNIEGSTYADGASVTVTFAADACLVMRNGGRVGDNELRRQARRAR